MSQRMSDVEGQLLRRLKAEDIAQVKTLCSDCFPIEYTEHWFNYVTSNKVYSLGCFLTGEGECNSQLISMVIGEEQPLGQVESEVGPILASGHVGTTVMYVISLGVLNQHRKQGHGSLLIHSLLAYVSTLPSCLAVYLHVQASNTAAQRFYNQVGFRELVAVPNYYYIKGNQEDAFLYCCYTNGGVVFTPTFTGYAFRYYEETRHCLARSCDTVTSIIRKLFSS